MVVDTAMFLMEQSDVMIQTFHFLFSLHQFNLFTFMQI